MAEAYPSVLRIMEEVPFGAFVRGLHAWTANIMIFMVILHLLKVFFISAYRPPRELTWVSGVTLFFVTVFFGFSGYLLPMNQLAYWATTVGTQIAGAFPVVGKYAQLFLLGGSQDLAARPSPASTPSTSSSCRPSSSSSSRPTSA